MIDYMMCFVGFELFNVMFGMFFINVGECINVIGLKVFVWMIFNGQFDEVFVVVCQQVENGVQVIDVNMDEVMFDLKVVMVCFLNLIVLELDIVCVLIMIDLLKWDVIEVGFKCVQGKVIVNLILLKEGEDVFCYYVNLICCYGVVVVVMVFDEIGQVDIYVCKIEICKCLYDFFVNEVGFLLEDIIFDLNIFVVVMGIEEYNNYVVDFIEVICWIKQNLLYVKVSGGVLNVLFLFCGNDLVCEVIYIVFLYYVIQVGMDMGIVNVGQFGVYVDFDVELCECVEDVILNCCVDLIDCLFEIVDKFKVGGVKKEENFEWCNQLVEKWFLYVLVYGIMIFIVEDIEEVCVKIVVVGGCLINVIEGLLMDGMNIVGDLFGQGKMFLLQVVKLVCVMKQVVVYLILFIEEEKWLFVEVGGDVCVKGKIVIVIVKGDVYDIGKNIVLVVFQCNNFEVVNMGVMVLCNEIFVKVKVEGVDIIGLLGFIMLSFEEMVYVVFEMQCDDYFCVKKILLLIGGVMMLCVYMVVKIVLYYEGLVVYVLDVLCLVLVVLNLLFDEGVVKYFDELKFDYECICDQYVNCKQQLMVMFVDVCVNKIKIDWVGYQLVKLKFIGCCVFRNYDLNEFVNYIDWGLFFQIWDFVGLYLVILNDEIVGELVWCVFFDVKLMFVCLIQGCWLIVNGVIVLLLVNIVNDDDIEIYSDELCFEVLFMWCNLCQQSVCLVVDGVMWLNCLFVDFIVLKELGVVDYIGMFVVMVGFGVDVKEKQFEVDYDDYSVIMLKVFVDCFVEVFVEVMYVCVWCELWGYVSGEMFDNDVLIVEKYVGICLVFGYLVCLDYFVKCDMFDVLYVDEIGMSVIDLLVMLLVVSVLGFYFVYLDSCYFLVGKIGQDQFEDYVWCMVLLFDDVCCVFVL